MNPFPGRTSFSLGQEPSSSNNANISMGLNHKFSLTGTFFSSSNVNNKKHSISKNEQQSPNDIKDSEHRSDIDRNDDKSNSADDRKSKLKNSPFIGALMSNLDRNASSTFVTPMLKGRTFPHE